MTESARSCDEVLTQAKIALEMALETHGVAAVSALREVIAAHTLLKTDQGTGPSGLAMCDALLAIYNRGPTP